MKKIILLVLVTHFCFAQDAIEIRLVNANVGGVDYSSSLTGTHSTDNAMNLILQNHNVVAYEGKFGHPLASLNNRIIQIACNNCDNNNLLNDLLNYNTVVESGLITNLYAGFSDAAQLKLMNGAVGIPTGVNSNNIITTNDIGLNQIFTNYNVILYEQAYPIAINPELLKYYVLACICNAQQLRNDLEAYNTVIEATDPVSAAYLLNTNDFSKQEINIHPNPFHDAVTIESEIPIEKYSLYDVLGKKIIETESIETLNTEIAKLNSGTYLLQLQLEDHTSITKKLLKN